MKNATYVITFDGMTEWKYGIKVRETGQVVHRRFKNLKEAVEYMNSLIERVHAE